MNFKTYIEDTVNAIIPFTLKELKEIKTKITPESLEKLLEVENYLFDVKLQTIVYNKKKIAKDPHMYESLSIYTWPNPDTKDGLPYITRDGYVNFEHVKNDKENLRLVSFVTYKLGILYFLTEDKKYYNALKDHLNYFFINPKTKMRPDMTHGQAHPGINDGCSGGIIDIAISFGYSLSVINSLKENSMLENEFVENLKEWTSDYLNWILTHPYGEDMKLKPNNHSMVYNYYVLMLSKFSDNKGPQIEEIKERYSKSVVLQIDEEGKMPLELKRMKSRSYTMMNTKLMLETYLLLDGDITNEAKNKIKKAVDYYMAYAQGSKEWEYQQTQHYYHFYDLGFIFKAKQIFEVEAKIKIDKNDLAISPWSKYLYRDLIEIEIYKKQEEKNDQKKI